MKKLRGYIALLTVCATLSGCSSSKDYKEVLKEVNMLDSGIGEVMENVTKMSTTEREQVIYQQITDRTLIDTNNLSEVSDVDIQVINEYVNRVKRQLVGQDESVLSSDFVNYLLFEMEKTPYIWELKSASILGVDENTGSYIVDINFSTKVGSTVNIESKVEDKTETVVEQQTDLNLNLVDESGNSIDNNVNSEATPTPTPTPKPTEVPKKSNSGLGKVIIPESRIVKGESDYDKKMQARYEKYMKIIKAKNGAGSMGFNWSTELASFEKAYGDLDTLYLQQKSDTLEDRLKNGYMVGYEGLCDSEIEKSHATMTVRLILSYKFVYGINRGISCDTAYITNYNLDKNPFEGDEEFDSNDYKNLIDRVDYLIYSEMKAIEESSYRALNNIIADFGKLDGYYNDMFEYTFRKHKGYAISIYDIHGTTVEACITRIRKVRAKGSNMSYPIYEEKVLYTIELVEDDLMITNEVLISSEMVGEPSIQGSVEDTSGFTETGELEESKKELVYEVIKKFNKLQLTRDVQSNSFIEIIDIGLTANNLDILRNNILNIDNIKQKYTWVESVNDNYDNYVNFTLKELFIKEDDSALECISTIGLIEKTEGEYKIISYITKEINNVDVKNLDLTGYMDSSTREK